MTALEQSIKEAVEKGGYELKTGFKATFAVGEWNIYQTPFIDPSFWQALGKARGWQARVTYSTSFKPREKKTMDAYWLIYWHRFIDHLAEEKDAESFFAELLGTKQQI